MNYHDAIKYSVFGKLPGEELTSEEEFCMQALIDNQPRTEVMPDLDDPATQETLINLWEFESKKDKNWQRFRQEKLEPLMDKGIG